MSILTKIVENKKMELKLTKQVLSNKDLEDLPFYNADTFSLKESLIKSSRQVGIIAEIKKASPSKGVILAEFNSSELLNDYLAANVEGISILTESQYFMGNIKTLLTARTLAGKTPLLRKDFIIDSYQIAEAKGYGASVVLLIAAILEENQYQELYAQTRELKMEVLTEINSLSDLNMVCRSFMPKLIGINNRNLNTFQTSLNNTDQLYKEVPKDSIIISESGIHSAKQIEYLKTLEVKGVLVGEHLVKSKNRLEAINELVGKR